MQLKIVFLTAGRHLLKFMMQNIYLKISCSQTVIFDLSQPGLPKTKKAEYIEA